MRIRLLVLAILVSCISVPAWSQLVGTDGFLQGHWLEVGVDKMGAFGTCTSPAGYHPHTCCGATCFTSGGNLDACYDWGHDGWSVGTPCEMGDYTIPGYPQEGWSIQLGGTEYRNWAGGGICTGPFTVPGSLTGYSNTGGIIKVIFTGTVAGVNIVQETRVDTNASWAVVTTTMVNTTAAPITGVYYERTCDPDNTSFWPGGTPTTENVIVHQNEDILHDVMVGAYGTNPGYNRLNSWLSLGTRDCRAKCGYLTGGLFPSTTPSNLWTGSGSVTALGDSDYNDVGIWLVFNVGTIAAAGTPGDSAIVSYAYIYNGPWGMDSAFPQPVLAVDSNIITNFPDTVDACMFPGVDSLSLDVFFGNDKTWSWGSWTWSPSTFLATSTGVHNKISLSALSGITTYTITGTDSALGLMMSCQAQQFTITIRPCHSAYTNYPCVGDALRLGMTGDSLGAFYSWTGPAGFSSALHDPILFPTSWADTGFYYVTRTIGSNVVMDSIHVNFHPLPVVVASSNITLCGPLLSPLNLTATPDSTGETFSWIGPNGFTSTQENPTIYPFDSTGTGVYVVTATSNFGCVSTTTTAVLPGAFPEFSFWIHRGCVFDTVFFYDSTFNANVYKWQFGDGDSANFRDVSSHLFRNTSTQVFTVSLTASNAYCSSTFSLPVDTRHSISAAFWPTPDTFCLGHNTTFTDNSVVTLAGGPGQFASYAWDYGNGVTDTVAQPVYTYDNCGHFIVTLTVMDTIGCTATAQEPVYVVKLSQTSFTDTTLCISQPLFMNVLDPVCPLEFTNYSRQYVWTQNTPNLSDTTIRDPSASGVGIFVDTLTISYPNIPDTGSRIGCAVRDTVTIHSVLGRLLTNVTPSTTISYGASIQLNADNEVYYYWKPNDGTLSDANLNNPVASPLTTTTYEVYGLDTNGCLDSAFVTINVDTLDGGGIPSAFTPNNDGLNDVFRIPPPPLGNKFDRLVEFRVFNRWGELIFNTNNKEVGWDGTYHGVPQDMGTYFYEIIISTPGGENITYKGDVVLIR